MNIVVTASPHIRDCQTTNKVMLNVILALIPASFVGVFLFGIQALNIIVSSMAFAIIIEYAINRIKKEKTTIYDGSAALTGLLLALTLPPSMPIWMVFIGNLVAIGIAKHTFGGLGHNIFNPAAVGRAFLFVAYPVAMTTWMSPSSWFGSSAITTATALAKEAPFLVSTSQLFMGSIPGCIGETSAFALLLGAGWLFYKKILDWKIPVSFFGTIFIFSLITQTNPFFHLFAGGVMLGGLFMLTDYVTSPATKHGRILFGIIAGILVMSLRLFSNLPEGMNFSILLVNIMVPVLDKIGIFIHLKLYNKKFGIKS
ncbi:MAG: RnfABCDGE type electron transport complex subunit D [Candidatus Margulisbacteria bacterium]|nr:RnfABCDGE type electron transport complex subunit D [Candidatus Margulisiibacteriota bacterium]